MTTLALCKLATAAVAAAFLFLYLESTDLQHPTYVGDHAPFAALQSSTHINRSITISASTFGACWCQGTVLMPLRMLLLQLVLVVLLLAAVLVC
jgi:hypothetical protein